MTTRVVFEDSALWKLPAGSVIRELGTLGRVFRTDSTPGRLWHGATMCTVHVLDMPVEVTTSQALTHPGSES